MFEQEHRPGVMGLSDFTTLKQVEVTIAGKPLADLLYHYRLAYSDWQYVQVIQDGESFIPSQKVYSRSELSMRIAGNCT
jgi:hypothetical protein